MVCPVSGIMFQRVWNWYSRESVQKALIEASKDREVASVFSDGRFGKRPNVINYQGDVLQAIAEGTVAFHGSVERWHNPMKLDVGLTRDQLNTMRKGWDILIDPDVADFDISRLTVMRIIQALKDHGITNYSLKFSGGKGFHIGVPFESMPDKINFEPMSNAYPEILQKIMGYIKHYIRSGLKDDIQSLDTTENIAKRVGKNVADITDADGIDPFKIVIMDVFSSRHLFRLPYSLHEKTLMVSLPLSYMRLENFDKSMAVPEKVKVDEKFLQQRMPSRDGEGFIIEALDWAAKNAVEKPEEKVAPRRQENNSIPFIPEDKFPPCIKCILERGLGDGKKRGVFILINFLRNMGWSMEEVEKKVFDWNQKNAPALSNNYLRSQLRWHFRQDRNLLPPNCENPNFYKAIGVYELCYNMHATGIKNPVNYPMRLMRISKKGKKGQKKKPQQ